jgi:hypothetical protein
MFTITWNIPTQCRTGIQVHYQRAIDPRKGEAEWSWGPGDGAFLVRCSEAVALAMISQPNATVEVYTGD